MTEMLTLGQAAKVAGVSRSTLSRAIKAGRLVATQDDGWVYRIDPRDLARAFGEGAAGVPAPAMEASAYFDDSLPDPVPAKPAAEPAMAQHYGWEAVHPSPEPAAAQPVIVAAPGRRSLLQRFRRLVGMGQSARA